MKTTYFTKTDTLFSITEKFPETVPLFTANGFPQLQDPAQRKLLGSAVTFEQALSAKKKNPDIFLHMLFEVIEQKQQLNDEGSSQPLEPLQAGCSIAGILPCPVKIPLLDNFKQFASAYEQKQHKTLSYRLRSASGGISWLEDEIRAAQSIESIPDLFISAGFELFFDKNLIGKYRDQGAFADLSGLNSFNHCFSGIDLKDPAGNYSILAGVPAIFLVDTLELNGRKKPETWDDLLSPEFENSISLPVEDLDLFNAVCLTLYKTKGIEAIQKLGKNMLSSLHPAQMVKTRKNSGQKPAVTVLPWFFTRMIFSGTSLHIVWPKDGAILSPVFIAARKAKAEELREIVHYFESPQVGTLLREKGFFPTVHPEVNNKIPEGNAFQWLGWDFIYSHDISALIARCTEEFNNAMGIEQNQAGAEGAVV